MSADSNILQFLPRANPKADRAFWKGAEPYGEKLLGLMSSADREAILRAGAVEIESVRVVTPADSTLIGGPNVFFAGESRVDQGRPSDSAFDPPDEDGA